MKKILTLLCILISFGAIAQTENLQGTYYSNSLTQDVKLKINEDKTFDMVILSGKYELGKDNAIDFAFDNVSTFVVREKEKGNKSTLKVTLNSNYEDIDLKFLYIGYEDENNEVKYENLYDKISATEAIQEAYTENRDTIYSLGTFEIPKTENLYLVNATQMASPEKKANVIIEKFPIKKDVSSVDVFTTLSGLYASVPKIVGKYNKQQQSIHLLDFYSEYDVLFEKKSRRNDGKNINKTSTDEVENWEYITYSQDENSSSDSIYSSVETKVKLDMKDNLADALKSVKKHNKLLLVFYQPENTEKAKEEFNDLISQYESGLSYYNEYEFSKYDIVDFYFADKKDEKWFKKKNIKTQNQFVCLNDNGEILYHEASTVSNIGNNIYAGSSFISVLEGAFIAKAIDDVFSNKKATISQIENVFLKALTSNSIPLYVYREKSNDEEQKDTQDWESYLENFKDIKNLYKFKSTPEQADKHWKRIIEAHKKDTQFDVPFATLLSKNYESYSLYYDHENYYKKLFDIKRKNDETDLEATQYLIKFNEKIQTYNDDLYKKEDDINLETININIDIITSVLNKIAEDSPELGEKVKLTYIEGKQRNVFDYENLKPFFEEFYPEEQITLFEDYYQTMTSADASNIILSLDKVYSQRTKQQFNDWIYYKNNFANECNNTAWQIVEKQRANKTLLEKALKWSKTSLELESENPHYLDTYAHLLYFTNNKEKAIETQRKAFQILENSQEDYKQELKEEIKQTLKKMESGSL